MDFHTSAVLPYDRFVPFRHFLVVNNVPCEECEYCGEQYFKVDVLKTIEKEFVKILSAKKKPKKQLKVPVEEFAELK